jgi:ubiquinone/menaquinone biosynthesis C-methylase UbiE
MVKGDNMADTVKSHGFFKFLSSVYELEAKIVMFGQYDRLRRKLTGKIEMRKGKRILDLATGTGYLAEIMAPADLICTDISIHMLKRARSNVKGNFVLADAHRLPFKDGVFGAAVSSFAMHEVARPSDVLAEMFRTLQPGGEIAVMDVVQQTQFLKKIILQIFHTFVELRTASYMNIADLKAAFGRADDFNMQWEMFGLVIIAWGNKTGA